MLVIGHRANSRRIVMLYRMYGVEYVEVDVSPGGGGEPLVMHGPSEVRRATPIGRLFAYIDYKLFYRDPIARPSPLAEWLARLDWVKGVLLDVKSTVDPVRLVAAVEEAGLRGRVEYASGDHPYLKRLKALDPGATVYPSIGERLADIPGYLAAHGFKAATIKYTVLDQLLTMRLKEEGVRVYAWTVNTREQAKRLASLGVDGIISDTPWSIQG